MKILVASKNPVKIEAAREAFSSYFENVVVEGVSVKSGVSDQPFDWDTFKGAKNRALSLREKTADYYVGMEGGAAKIQGQYFTFGVFCIIDKSGFESFGSSPLLPLPKWVFSELRSGKELGTVMDEIMGDTNTKQKGGAPAFFTNGVVDRKSFYIQGLQLALSPFLKKDLYEKGTF